jgi:hypothetical protein
MSNYVWRIFLFLVIWAFGNYVYFRYMHLRFHRINFYSSSRLNDTYMYFWGGAVSVVAAQIPLWGFRSELIFEFLGVNTNNEMYRMSRWQVKMVVLLIAWALAMALWLCAYHFLVRPRSKRRGCSSKLTDYELTHHQKSMQDKSVQEVKMHFVYSWLNTNPAYVLKCKYFFKDPDGQDTAHRQGHPLACGDDEDEVRFFEVGKEYLFLRPERLHLLHETISDFMEPEYWIDRLTWRFGQLTTLCRKRADKHIENMGSKMGTLNITSTLSLGSSFRPASTGYKPIEHESYNPSAA